MKKIIIALTLTLTLLLGGTVTALASEEYTVSDYISSLGWPTEYLDANIKDGYNYTIICDPSITDPSTASYLTVYAYEEDIFMYFVPSHMSEDDKSYRFYVKNNSNVMKHAESFRILSDGSITTNQSLDIPDVSTGGIILLGTTKHIPIYTSRDVYTSSDCTQVFFHKELPPQTLQAVAEKVEMVEVMKQVVGLIPLVIGLVVLVIALRKALATLQTALHRA